MMMKLLAVAAVVTLAQAQSVSELEKALAAAKEAKAAEKELEKPQIQTAGGGIHFRVARGADTKFTRLTEEEASLFDLAEKVDKLTASVDEALKVQTSVDATLESLTASLKAVVPTIAKIDGLYDSIAVAEKSFVKLAEAVDGVDAKIAAKMGPVQASVDKALAEVEASIKSTEDALEKAADKLVDVTVPAKLKASSAMAKKITDALTVKVKAAAAAAAAASTDSIYIQWGRKKCTAASGKTVKTIYRGYTYANRHNYNGGGAIPLCVENKGGHHGGHSTGGDSSDMIVPLRTDHCGYTGGTIWNSNCGDIVPCARCFYKNKKCYMAHGEGGKCTDGYEVMYTGMMWGGHEGHHGNVNRFCIDKDGDNNDWNQHINHNAYVYPTIKRGSVNAIGQQATIKCSMCCQK